jgi:hypothetical protein
MQNKQFFTTTYLTLSSAIHKFILGLPTNKSGHFSDVMPKIAYYKIKRQW